MPVVLLHGVDASVTSLGAPTFQQINDALQTIQLLSPTDASDLGSFVGPRPRVVRRIETGAPRSWLVHFSWPYQWADGLGAAADNRVRGQLLEAAQRQLNPTSADWSITVEPYTPAVNGDLAWWQSGAGSVTQTGDEFPTMGGRLDATENPIGPTTAATHPGTVAGAAASALGGATELLKALIPLFAIGIGVYLADKLGAFSQRSRPRRRAPAYDYERPIPAGAVANPDYSRLAENGFFNPDIVRLSPSESTRWRTDAAFRRRLTGQLQAATRRVGRDLVVVDARTQYVTTFQPNPRPPEWGQPNPRPPEWGQYAPSTPYPCKPWEAGIVGLLVPGRGGGTVTSCATPAEPLTARRRRGQVQIGLPGVGAVMPKSRARARIRRAGLDVLKTPVEDVAQAVDAYSRSSCPLPYAPGIEFPHTVSKCDPEHKLWKGYDGALEEARERASMIAEDAGPAEFECIVVEELQRDPRYPQWHEAASKCARGFESRQHARKPKAQFSAQRERGQVRARAIASGEDVTGAEYRDAMALRRNPFIGRR